MERSKGRDVLVCLFGNLEEDCGVKASCTEVFERGWLEEGIMQQGGRGHVKERGKGSSAVVSLSVWLPRATYCLGALFKCLWKEERYRKE